MELDHIVHFLNRNPKVAINVLEQYGLKAVSGGSHRTWGTYNTLLYLGKSYIEYLAVENPQISNKSENPLVKQLLEDSARFEGFGQICFRTHNINRLKENLLAKGFAPSKIFEGSREREDGVTIRWKMLFLLKQSTLPYPFFIEWEQNDDSRFNELKEKGFITKAQEKVLIKSISIVVADAEVTATDWSHLFSVPFEKQHDQAVIRIGDTQMIFRNPSGLDLTNVINLKGERPYLIEFEPSLQGGPFLLFGDLYS